MDTLYTGGRIYTMAGAPAEAVLTRGERIVYAGALKEARAQASANAEVVHLDGRTLAPAFPDAHSHLTAFAQTLRLAPLQGARDLDQVISRMKAHIEKNRIPEGEWVLGFGYEQNDMREKRHPTREVLDRVSTTHPVMVTQMSGHMGAVNSLALRLLGLDAGTPDPEGGRIGRQDDGATPNGYLEERAFTLAGTKIPPVDLEENLRLLDQAQEIYLANGITTAQEGLTRQGEWDILTEAERRGRLKMDVVAYVDWNGSAGLYASGRRAASPGGRLRMGGAKLMLDGSPQNRTAYMTQPYAGGTDRGYPALRDGQLLDLLRSAKEAGAQVLAHCNGDAAAEQLIWAVGQVYPKGNDARTVMIHAQTVTADQLARMKELGIIPSFFASHIEHFGDTHLRNLGDRAQRISPCGTAQRLSLPFTLHMDTPVLPPNLMDALSSACRRVTASGVPLDPSERITPAQGLRALTLNAAHQYFQEGEKGSLEAGKRADMLLLSQDPLTAPNLKAVRVERVVLRGQML